MSNLDYPVGGSLSKENPFYVQRPADTGLYESIRAGEFCYVFNSRQMGKSSLLVRTQDRLEQENFRCCTVDLTSIGSETVTPQQWYKGVVFELWRGFGLRKQFDFRVWWQDEADLSVLQRLQHFITDILFNQFAEHLVIFIDEIDSILSLPFPVDDFFALIRFCYNQRATDPIYNRISFVLAGVTTPSDLIQDKNRTPFNIGRAIELTGFDYESATLLLKGLEAAVPCPQLILKEIIDWTGGQPFLTQKLCQLVSQTARHSSQSRLALPPGTEAFWISSLIHDQIIHRWESQDEPEHLRTIRDRISHSGQQQGRLLGLYQQILQAQEGCGESREVEKWENGKIERNEAMELGSHPSTPHPLIPPPHPSLPATDSREQVELLLTGLVIKHQGFLAVKNRIYQQVFNLTWVELQLANLRPYSQALDAWMASGQMDRSRLLRGQALKAAQQWAEGKTLSDRDYQFLAASQDCDRQETQQALEAARLQEVEARLLAEQSRFKQERRAARLQRLLLIALSLALIIALLLGFNLRQQYQAAVERERQTKVSEIRALMDSSAGLFASNQKLDALVAALRARAQLKRLGEANSPLQTPVDLTLQQAISGADEYNRLADPAPGRFGLAVSPDGSRIVTSGQNNWLHLWAKTGEHLRALEGHTGPILALAISPKGNRMVSGSSDRTIRLWQLDGTFFRSLEGHQGSILALAISPDGQIIASGSDDRTIKLWRFDGTLVRTLTGHAGAVLSLGFTGAGEIVSGSEDGTVKRWLPTGELLASLDVGGRVLRVAIHPQNDQIATASDDQTVKLWTLDGTLLSTLRGHTGTVNAVSFSPDGSLIASASSDRTVKLWTPAGTLLKTFAAHRAPVSEVAFLPLPAERPDLISLGWDNKVRLWHSHNQLLTALTGHRAEVWTVAFSPGGRRLASASSDQTVRLWQINQRPRNQQRQDQPSTLRVLPGPILVSDFAVRTLAFSPDGQLATAGANPAIALWTEDGQPRGSFKAHNSEIRALAFSPNARFLASASTDSTVKVWTLRPGNLRPGNYGQEPPLLAKLTGHASGVFALAFSPNSRVIASASSDGTVRLWTPDGRSLSTFRQHQQPVWAVAFNPIHNQLASAGEDQTILIWQPNGMVLERLEGHETSVRALAYSPDGSRLASGSQDGTIKLWRQGRLLTTLKGHSASVTSLEFSPNGQLLASASENNTVLLWDLEKVESTDQTLTYGCQWVQDYLHTLNPQADSFCELPP